VRVEFVCRGRAVPGVNPVYAAQALADLPDDGESVDLWKDESQHPDWDLEMVEPNFYGALKNHGLGPALDTRVTWIAEEVWVGNERFNVDERERTEPVYSTELNSMPAVPMHIEPGGEAELTRLPMFIGKDLEKKVSVVAGRLSIACKDIFGVKHLRCTGVLHLDGVP
jgi:hypothetical protein